MSQVICIKNLDFFVDEDRLSHLFGKFGRLLSVHLMKDEISRTSQGTAYVEFEHDEDAQESIDNMNGRVVDNRMISVRRSKAKIYSSARQLMKKMKRVGRKERFYL